MFCRNKLIERLQIVSPALFGEATQKVLLFIKFNISSNHLLIVGFTLFIRTYSLFMIWDFYEWAQVRGSWSSLILISSQSHAGWYFLPVPELFHSLPETELSLNQSKVSSCPCILEEKDTSRSRVCLNNPLRQNRRPEPLRQLQLVISQNLYRHTCVMCFKCLNSWALLV